MVFEAIGFTTLAIWIYVICARGGFWLEPLRHVPDVPAPARWPSVTAVVPARDEAACVADSVRSLLLQNYPGALSVVLVDDNSADGTGKIAKAEAAKLDQTGRLAVVSGRPLESGWTGKMWALRQGVEHAERSQPDYILFTDADIVHDADTIAWLVARAEAGQNVLTSLMAHLRCESFAEKVHVPAFIFFFQMLYPFAWVNRPRAATAAAAGGCMLVRTDALRRAGGIDCIRDALIDDCALAAAMKKQGPIRLGLTRRVRSIRPYPHQDDFRRMVVRSAYAQLRYSPLLLAGTIAGMVLTYLTPPVLALLAHGPARFCGIAAWIAMAVAVQPILRFYRVSPVWGPLFPIVALLYLLYTIESAVRHAQGRGGVWKGRAQSHVSATR
ncbi:MAG TPA: glycosyltransferase [Xanthobacteraceae bacterium]|jgi:hopene-associated glycosyltransferase HpnB|nr:glycosyltransferase [Xanthobacteraceae bacterium]